MKQRKQDKLIQKSTDLYNTVYRFALSRVKNREAAQDIAQTVMETVIKRLDTLKDESSLESWIKAITQNKIQDYFRELKRRQEWTIQDPRDEDVTLQIQDEEADILDILTSREANHHLAAAVIRLSELHRRIIVHYIIYGESLTSIAENLQMNYHTVKSHYRRGIAALREEFLKLQEDNAPSHSSKKK